LPARGDLTDHRRVLLLSPSAGLGGGIERYVETLEWAFRSRSIACQRVDLDQPGPAGHRRLLWRASRQARRDRAPVRVVAAHRALLPAALVVAACRYVTGVSVICHGSDVWGPDARPRWWLEKRAMRADRVRVVAVSDFTAGAVGVSCRATVLTPGLAAPWFATLRQAGATTHGPAPGGPRLITAFRLADWRDKGLPELLTAIRLLGRPDVSLTICGSGRAPAELTALLRTAPHCQVRSGLSDTALAQELAAADLLVLATRTRSGRCPSGEGFGLVLLEAQVAGTPVVAPASGGSRGAYLEGVTGVAPVDESAQALAGTLREVLSDAGRLARMRRDAADWAQRRYDPGLYAEQAVSRLL
jgi:phosphatidyl-myo-inositol dimannoside synthase